MKLQILIEVDVSKTIAGTMQRSGFEIVNNGSSIQIQVGNSPVIPQRKTKVVFIECPTKPIDDVCELINQSCDQERHNNGSEQ